MRVLFQSHFDLGRMYGGGPSVVHGLKTELERLGVTVTLHDYWKHDPRDFDLLHYFSCNQNEHWLTHRGDDPPLVVTPISWFEESPRRRWEDRIKFAARAIRHRTRDPAWLRDPFAIPAAFFPNSRGEAERLTAARGVQSERMMIVPHGVSDQFAQGSADAFMQKFGVRDPVLCVGRFEYPRKNQLALIRALEQEDLPVVFVGGPESGSEGFYEECRAAANGSTHFLGPLAHDDPVLVSAYRAAKVVVMPALLESPGLSGLEGALAGANVAATRNGSTREYFGEEAWYFDPTDLASIRSAVRSAHAAPRNGSLVQRVSENYTWERIAPVQLKAYEAVLRTVRSSGR